MTCRRLVLAIAAAVVVALAAVALPASATVAPPRVLAGPDPTILDVGGAALAPDGSGGVVYRKLVDGKPHLFAVRYLRGGWSAPIRVDGDQPYAASFPAIAAGTGGRLLVVWATPWATRRDRKTHFVLTSAVLAPGATGFGPAVEVDGNDIGDGSAAYPSLAMTPGGSAYVAYRVVTNPLDVNAPAIGVQPMRPGDELVDVRAARFNGMTWSSVGNVNRLRNQVTMRRPTAANAPAIGVNRRGDAAVVTWQEPTIDGVARIWARRLFGTTQGVVLPVSPTALDGTPVGADADAPAVAVSSLSEARFAFRLQGGLGSPTGSSQLLSNGLPPLTDDAAGRLLGLARLDAAAAIGPPSVALDDDGYFRVGYSADGGARLVTGDPGAISAPITLQAGASDPVLVTRDPQQGGVTAWGGTDDGGRPVVKVRQEFDDGQWQIAHLTAPVSGDINGLSLGRAPGGDALVAFRQGAAERSRVVASIASARPTPFLANVPDRWIRATAARVRWDAAASVLGDVTYSILLDGIPTVRGLRGRYHRFDARGLGDGRHSVQIVASDTGGQQTASPETTLRVDGNPPTVDVRRRGLRGVAVTVSDAGSGVRTASTAISFGDRTAGVRGRKRATHRYARAGRYVVIVRSRDRVGNARTWRVRVQAR